MTSDTNAPVPSALVALFAPGADAPTVVARTDSSGRYCFETLDAAAYTFSITAPSQTAMLAVAREVSPVPLGAPATERSTFDVKLGGPGVVLHGRVTDDVGAPLERVPVLLPKVGSPSEVFVTETGEGGRYQVKLPAGVYAPKVNAERYRFRGAELHLDQDQGLDFRAQRVNPKDQGAPEDIVAWLKKRAIPLSGVEAGAPLADMEPLGALVGDARVVGLGEGAHGTRELALLKHRTFEFLVEKLGFRVFAIDAGFGDVLPLSEYVRTGKEDPKRALGQLGLWEWDTEEALALVTWMRRYNEDSSHTEKLAFWGAAPSAASSAHALLSFLWKVDPPLAADVKPMLAAVDDDFSAEWLAGQPESLKKAPAEAVKKIAAALDAQRDEYIKKTNERAHRMAKLQAKSLAEFLKCVTGDEAARGRALAELATELSDLSGPGAKLALWAQDSQISEANEGSFGARSAKKLGAGYLSTVFKMDEGAFQAVDGGPSARGQITFTAPSAPAGSLDHTLSRSALPIFAVGLGQAPKGPVADWLSSVTFSRSIAPFVTDPVSSLPGVWEVPIEHWDAVFFVQKTTASKPLVAGKAALETDSSPVLPAIVDSGFEGEKKLGKSPAGWSLASRPRTVSYRARLSNRKCWSGKRCVLISREKSDFSTGMGTFSAAIDASAYRGKKVRAEASVRVEGKTTGDDAFFSLTAKSPGKKAGTRPKMAWAQAPSVEWKRVRVELDVPQDASQLVLAMSVTGAAVGGLDEVVVGLATEGETKDK